MCGRAGTGRAAQAPHAQAKGQGRKGGHGGAVGGDPLAHTQPPWPGPANGSAGRGDECADAHGCGSGA